MAKNADLDRQVEDITELVKNEDWLGLRKKVRELVVIGAMDAQRTGRLLK
jgi:hypothetical protein